MNVKLIKADVNLFATYQTIYSNSDTEMWYDWNERLEDTKWATDQCYFLELDCKRIGGAVITDDAMMFAFLIPPFTNRAVFWQSLLKVAPRPTVYGVLTEDKHLLTTLGYSEIQTKQIMVRPSDTIETPLTDGFICRAIDVETEIEEIAKVLRSSFLGGIVYEKTGEKTLEEVVQQTRDSLAYMDANNFSFVIEEVTTSKIVAVCLAGVGKENPLGYAFIDELAVLPKYQGKGLAKQLVNRVVTASHGIAPFVKLGVIEGNHAELLYRQLGFIAGPKFSDFKQRGK